MCFFWFFSTFPLHRQDFFAKWGQKGFLPVLAEFYTFIGVKAVEKHPDYLVMVKDETGSGR